MAGESTAPVRTRPSGRVWLVVACAIAVAVFLAVVLPGVFDVKHSKRTYVILGPVERIVFDSKGTADIEISPSTDGKVHVLRKSSISRDSRLRERRHVAGKTLTLRSSCTGSRLGVLRRCDFHYHLRVPRRVALDIRVHFGRTTIHGIRGRLDFKSDAGDLVGYGCHTRAYLSVAFGKIDYHDTCVPTIVHARVKAGDLTLTVPAGRYDVQAGHEARRPFENIIEDPASRSEIDVDATWAGSIQIKGARR
jgi:hypothetical protein